MMPKTPPPESLHAHNRYQRAYYESVHKPNMQPRSGPYVERQLDRLLRHCPLDRSEPVLEVGAGLGRYTLPLLDRGFEVVAVDLSPVMLERLRERAASDRLRTVACDLAHVEHHVDRTYRQAVGFFTLHHMHDLELVLNGLARVLEPGSPAAFLEPNAYNPLYYLQILLTPRMTWRGDKGVARMRRRPVLGAMEKAGFERLALERFGAFPPSVVARRWGRALEDRLQAIRPLDPVLAFQIFSGRRSP